MEYNFYGSSSRRKLAYGKGGIYINASVVIYLLSIISFPFYIFSSGGMQISSVFFLFFIVYSMISLDRRYLTAFNSQVYPLYVFLVYALIVSLSWSFITKSINFFGFILIYIFDLLIFFSTTLFLVKNRIFFRAFPRVIAISVILQFVLSFFVTNNGSLRASLFFNNPNQLGYYALLSSCILVVFNKKGLLTLYWFYPSMLATIWLAQLSLSTATLISILILLAYSIFSNTKSLIFTLLFCTLVIPIIMNIYDIDFYRVDVILDRFAMIGEGSDESLEGRGYDRIWNHPVISLIGGGEGAVDRWNSYLSESEIHSSWATLLFSYGVIGFVSFIVFLKKIVFSERLITLVPFLTIALYGITHNGLRFIYFWLFLSVCLAFSLKKD